MTEIPEARLWTYVELVELEHEGRLSVSADRVTFEHAGHRFGFHKSALRNARAFVEQHPGSPGECVSVDWLGPISS